MIRIFFFFNQPSHPHPLSCNLGYAFVNATTPGAAATMAAALHGAAWAEFASRKVCAVARARVQGKAALVDHFRGARFPADDPGCLPLAIELGPPVPGAPDAPRFVAGVTALQGAPHNGGDSRGAPVKGADAAARDAAAYLAAKEGGKAAAAPPSESAGASDGDDE